MNFFFVRHGESAHNAAGLWCGSMDSPLTAAGKAQADQAAALLSETQLSWIVSSPQQRALHTAERIAVTQNLEVTVDGRLREHCKGVLEGTAHQKLDSSQWGSVKGAESMCELYNRVLGAMKDLTQRDGDGAVVAHAGVARAIEAIRTRTDPEELYNLPKIGNGKPYMVTLDLLSVAV